MIWHCSALQLGLAQASIISSPSMPRFPCFIWQSQNFMPQVIWAAHRECNMSASVPYLHGEAVSHATTVHSLVRMRGHLGWEVWLLWGWFFFSHLNTKVSTTPALLWSSSGKYNMTLWQGCGWYSQISFVADAKSQFYTSIRSIGVPIWFWFMEKKSCQLGSTSVTP